MIHGILLFLVLGLFVGSFAASDAFASTHRDLDGDGVNESIDLCADTPSDEKANSDGCSPSQLSNFDPTITIITNPTPLLLNRDGTATCITDVLNPSFSITIYDDDDSELASAPTVSSTSYFMDERAIIVVCTLRNYYDSNGDHVKFEQAFSPIDINNKLTIKSLFTNTDSDKYNATCEYFSPIKITQFIMTVAYVDVNVTNPNERDYGEILYNVHYANLGHDFKEKFNPDFDKHFTENLTFKEGFNILVFCSIGVGSSADTSKESTIITSNGQVLITPKPVIIHEPLFVGCEFASMYTDTVYTRTIYDSSESLVLEKKQSNTIISYIPTSLETLTAYCSLDSFDGGKTLLFDVIHSKLITPISLDENPPEITLLGNSTAIVKIGETYIDAGATANDVVDGDISLNIITINPVIDTTIGNYTITYDVIDSSGNDASTVTRDVLVIDSDINRIQISRGTLVHTFDLENPRDYLATCDVSNIISQQSFYMEMYLIGNNPDNSFFGKRVADDPFTSITDVNKNVIKDKFLNYPFFGVELICIVSDEYGQVEDTVRLEPLVLEPIITPVNPPVVGTQTKVDCEYDNVEEYSITAEDADGTVLVTSDNTPLFFNVTSTDEIIFTCQITRYQDFLLTNGPKTSTTVTPVLPADNISPTLDILGNNPMILNLNGTLVDPGATCIDDIDGDLTDDITIKENTVDTSLVGDYTILYSCTDSAGNENTINRNIKVVDRALVISVTISPTPVIVNEQVTFTCGADKLFGDSRFDIYLYDDDGSLLNERANVNSLATFMSSVGPHKVECQITTYDSDKIPDDLFSKLKNFNVIPFPVIPILDSDGDGINDDVDLCPDTLPNAPVDENGCIILPPIGPILKSDLLPIIITATDLDLEEFSAQCISVNINDSFTITVMLGAYVDDDESNPKYPLSVDKVVFYSEDINRIFTNLTFKEGTDFLLYCTASSTDTAIENYIVVKDFDEIRDTFVDEVPNDDTPIDESPFDDPVIPTLTLENDGTYTATCDINIIPSGFSMAVFYINDDVTNPDLTNTSVLDIYTSKNPEENSIGNIQNKSGLNIKMICIIQTVIDGEVDGFSKRVIFETPEPDSDNDGINDDVDACINEAETFNGFEDTDGCPDTLPVDGSPPVETTNNKKNGGCADCVPPTLGLDEKFMRVVESGFSYNGVATQVDFWYTAYPLITTNVGDTNTVEILVYENSGIHNMKMVQFGLGATHLGQPLSTVEVLIEVYLETNNTDDYVNVEKLLVRDDDNLIGSVFASASVTECIDDAIKEECVKVVLHYSYRETTINNMMVVSATDHKRNTQNFYFNHGVQVVGDSLNVPPTHIILNKGYSQQTEDLTLTLTRTDKINHIWEDKNGIEYFKVSEFRFDRITPEASYECTDPPLDTINVPTRNNCHFRELISLWS